MSKPENADQGRMSPVTLRFQPVLEREFKRDFKKRNRVYAPVAFGSAILLFSFYALLDWILAPARLDELLLVRLGVAVPCLLVLLGIMISPLYYRYMQPILALSGLIAAIAVDTIMWIGWPELKFYFFGVIIVNLYVQVFGRVLFTWSTATSVLNIAIFVCFMILLDASFEDMAMSLFFICSTTCLGMIVGWSTERLWRGLFLRDRNLVQVNAELRASSQTDPLTGLLNRRGMMEELQREHNRLDRSGRSYVIALLDLDHFKLINDTWGHECGDAILVEVSRLFQRVVRNTDLVSRWGGEEFLFLLPDTRLAGGRIIIEKIRRLISGTSFTHAGHHIPVSVTAGIREAGPGTNISVALKQADNAMYKGKKQGRNQSVLSLPESHESSGITDDTIDPV